MIVLDPAERETLLRMLDANFNRALEGLRVCEDIFRFVWSDSKKMEDLRNARHNLSEVRKTIDQYELLQSRSSISDPGNRSFDNEMNRSKIDDILFANFQRVKESLRVLEEGLKLIDPQQSEKIKEIRFTTYECEKKINS